MKSVAERLGLDGDNLGTAPTITLGVYNANTTQMAGAYGTFAAGGVHRDPTGIMKVTDRSGNVLVDNTAGVEGKQVITDSVAYAVTQVLEGVIYNASYGTANAAALPSGQIAAGKTGTTDDWHDLWFVGYTPQLSCAVWTGSRDNSVQLETNTWCQEIWRDLISACLQGQPNEDFKSASAPNYNSAYKGGGKSEDEDEEKKEEEATEETTEEASGETTGGTSGAETPGGTTGETPGGATGETPGGTTGGGTTAPDPGSSSTPGSGTAGGSSGTDTAG